MICIACSEWIVHKLPRYLVLSGSEIIQALAHGEAADSDVVDVLVRRLYQLDTSTQSDNVLARWRHFLESDFAVCRLVFQFLF